MGKYRVQYKELSHGVSTFTQLSASVDKLQDALNTISSGMDGRQKSMETLRTRVREKGRSLNRLVNVLGQCGAVLQDVSTRYEITERNLAGELENVKTGVDFITENYRKEESVNLPFVGKVVTGFSGSALHIVNGNLTTDLGKWAVGVSGGLFVGAKNSDTWKPIEQGKTSVNQYAYDKATRQMRIYDTIPYAKKVATILEAKAEAKAEYSVYETTLAGETSWGKGEVSATLGTAEAHAGVSAGLYVFDKDGNKLLAPSVKAEIGASVCAVTLAASGKVGNDMLGGYGDAKVEVLKAEAKATATVSFLNEKGELNVQAQAKASAEAVALKVSGRAGATVLGADVGVTGSLVVGVGAHAEVGITNGVVKVDIGASLGVGVSLGFEVDVGGTVKAACGVAGSAFNALSKFRLF